MRLISIEAQAYQRNIRRSPSWPRGPGDEDFVLFVTFVVDVVFLASVANGQDYTKRTAGWTARFQAQRTLMHVGDPLRDRQSQSRPFGPARWIKLHEAVEDA